MIAPKNYSAALAEFSSSKMRSFARPLRLFSGHDLPKLSMARHLPAQARYQSSSPGPNGRPKRIVVAVTGATGSPLAVALLQRLRELDVETHLVMSKWGGATLKYELEVPNNTTSYLESLASVTHSSLDVSASLSSGSFRTDGMIVVPCSMKTLAGIRMGYDNDLIVRAASVTLKERRRLVLVARETPLTSIYLENMLEVTKAGAVVFPPVMAFYTRPSSIDDMVQQSVMRMIDLLDLEVIDGDMQDEARWSGFDWAAKGRQNA